MGKPGSKLSEENIRLTNYLDGLFHMASSCSTWIGPSYIETLCMDQENYARFFTEHFLVPMELLENVLTNETLKEALTAWLGANEPRIVEGLVHWMQFDLGKAAGIFRLTHSKKLVDALSQCNGGLGRFYFMEDILFIAFPGKMVCLMMGNDE